MLLTHLGNSWIPKGFRPGHRIGRVGTGLAVAQAMPFIRPERIDELTWERLMGCDRTARLVARLERLPFPHMSLGQAADIACMEPTAFSRFFHHRIGVKFSEFLRAYRVSRALREMEERDAPLKEIAGRAGFRSLATFDRAVKRETGASPSKVRHALFR